MLPLFADTRKLDAAAAERFALTDDILMENAASVLEKAVMRYAADFKAKNAPPDCSRVPRVLVAAGGGDNGGDGYALARRLAGRSDVGVCVFAVKQPKSAACVRQAARAEKCGVRITHELEACSILVECICGSGLRGALSEPLADLISRMNSAAAVRIACDVPCGIAADGSTCGAVFCADLTVVMGALKTCLFGDQAKPYTGRIECAGLGIAAELYESAAVPDAFLLEQTDLCLPHRTNPAVHKGSFGHAAIVSGEKSGAAVIAASAAFRFGAGLVTIVRAADYPLSEKTENIDVPRDNSGGTPPRFSASPNLAAFPELMSSDEFPPRTAAAAFGMGLGRNNPAAPLILRWLRRHADIPCVIDADMCYSDALADFLETRGNAVITPHAAEFQSLLKLCGFGEFSIERICAERFSFAARFSEKYPSVVIVAKGANPVIAQNRKLFVNPHGKPCLAKAGSGDVLAGLICGLLAQGRTLLDAAVQGSLAHALASAEIPCDYAMTPFSLLEAAARL
ncbi:MAG: NAD(P)H-hydrate dehydratase [Bacteroides sp.]|nr:NAD(P)H-hydrate dehydratase [Prevotella sp.]MCM1407197.1 NAD(P)H-hydrate dehydratase [Treponema brennaborense]MCM1470349.1 NAD(P)H-hydrate dehydratase [Bacteroides sp.]